jgi:hypothetical protein
MLNSTINIVAPLLTDLLDIFIVILNYTQMYLLGRNLSPHSQYSNSNFKLSKTNLPPLRSYFFPNFIKIRWNIIDASYQVSGNLAEGFQRRRLKCEKLTDDRRRTPSDDKSSHCLWQGERKRGKGGAIIFHLILMKLEKNTIVMGEGLFSLFQLYCDLSQVTDKLYEKWEIFKRKIM